MCVLLKKFIIKRPQLHLVRPLAGAWRARWFQALVLLALLPVAQGWARAHPFMFYTAADKSVLKAKVDTADPFYADIFNEIKIDCRSSYGPSKSINTSSPDRRYWQAIRSHASLMFLDPVRAADSAYQSNTRFFKYYNAVLNYSGWSNMFGDDSITAPYLLAGLIIGYDMNYASFSSTQRADIVKKLAARADYLANSANTDGGMLYINPDFYDAGAAYIHNFKVLRNKFVMSFSALGLLAYGLEGEVNETQRQNWLKVVDTSLAAWNKVAMADGVSLESYSYDELMSEIFFMFLEVKTRVTGVNQFVKYPYVTQYPYYQLYSWIPGGDRSFVQCMPWGDCETGPAGDMRMNVSIFARRLKGTSYNSMGQLANWMAYRPLEGTANNSYSREDPHHFYYADSSVSMLSPTQLALPTFHYFPKSGVFVWRSGWDNMATYFALTCSPQLGGHQKPEMGNFVIYKGGAPFIASHGYLKNHRTVDNNVMMIGGKGQLGENPDDISSKPVPPANYAKVTQVLADNLFFNVMTDLKPIYAESRVSQYTREFLGFADFYFIRDKTACTASLVHQNNFHAFMTVQPALGDDEAVDLDSNPTGNPWSGSGTLYSLKPRTAGPYTGSMVVRNLSLQSWSGSLSNDMVRKSSSSDSQRGKMLSYSLTSNNASSVMAFCFPGAQSVSKWAGSDGEGFKVTLNGAVKMLGVWPNNGSINGTDGLKMTGTMGGIHVANGWFWGRNISSLSYNGTQYLSSTMPVTIFSNTLLSSGNTVRLIASQGGTVSLRCLVPVKEVWLNGTKMSTTQWTLSNNTLKITFSGAVASGGIVLKRSPASAADPAWVSLKMD